MLFECYLNKNSENILIINHKLKIAGLIVYKRSDILAINYFFEIAVGIHIKNHDRQIIFLT